MKQSDDFDSPWKEALEHYFREFIEFFFPAMQGEVDWEHGHDFLDKELQQVAKDAKLGPRLADKLVRVWRKSGDEEWVLVHIEVQAQYEVLFAKRMYVYNYRLFDRYDRPVVSLAVLADDRAGWRPDHYTHELWGCRVGISFPVVKLIDYNWKSLEASANPFAVCVMAHLKAQETRRNGDMRYHWKLSLVRRLYDRGYSRKDVLRLFRFIDWVLDLPEELEQGFWDELSRYEKEKKMPYVTSVERIGIKKGIQKGWQQGWQEGKKEGKQEGRQEGVREGLLKGIELALELKFGDAGLHLMPEIRGIEDVDVLTAIHEGLKTASSPEELRRIYK